MLQEVEYSRETVMGGSGLASQVLGLRFIDAVWPDGDCGRPLETAPLSLSL